MTKAFVFFVCSLVLSASASATSLHPCTPTVKAQDTILSCKDGSNFVQVRVETLMSNRRICPDPGQYMEYKTAKLETFNSQGTQLGTQTLNHDQFTYSLGGAGSTGEASFTVFTSRGPVTLKCVTPVYGGVSFGN